MSRNVIQLKCSCNNYHWGRVGKDSLAARLCQQTNPDFKLDEKQNYAEMWMGTYPELPSYSLATGEDLQDILNKNKERLIGQPVVDKFGADLPFLPKILSISKALPLQIHPDIELSKKLHKEDPEKYSDTNHKPEIAVALGKFEAFVGFKRLVDIERLMSLDTLKAFVPSKASDGNDTLRQICRNILIAPPDQVGLALKGLQSTPCDQLGDQAYILDLIPRLESMYGIEDNGNLVALLCMNFLVLDAGSAIYIPADGIHAYLSGNIIECMARSNNVINTGFCPRADRDDIDLFVDALTFQQHDPEEPILKRQKSEKSTNGKTDAFKPPMSEFNMLFTALVAGEEETVREIKGPSIAVAVSGSGRMNAGGKNFDIGEGSIYFIGQGVEVKFSAKDTLQVYRAYVE
jgi:mannose-6-phosphate isomerase